MANVEVIGCEHKKYPTTAVKKPRACVYARVSTEQDGQASSYDNQVEIFTKLIKDNSDWEFAGVYADLGKSGTSEKRPEYSKMMKECENGKIDIIITKSISRFARNTLITLEKIRWLKQQGVRVIFNKEGIDTMQPYSEMLLTILAAFAQEESRNTSERTKKGIRMLAEKGTVRWRNSLGYCQGNNDEYLIDESTAKIIRLIYEMYDHGNIMSEITNELNNRHLPTPKGKKAWVESSIRDILVNERYVGDIITNKFYAEDHLSHRNVRNKGDIEQIKITDHHPGIIDRRTWNRVQLIREMRSKQKGYMLYPFNDKLHCPYCGKSLIQQSLNVGGRLAGWLCIGCRDFIIISSYVEAAVIEAYNQLDLNAVKQKIENEETEVSEKAKLMLKIRNDYPKFEKVDYWWVDDLIDYIEFGSHKSIGPSWRPDETNPSTWEDSTITVFWKCGIKTTLFSGIKEYRNSPKKLLEREAKIAARKRAKSTNK